MDQYQALIGSLGLALGASWASGINLYAAILALGLSANYGVLELPQNLAILQEPIVILAAGLMYCVEFFADKTPGVDTLWDVLHSFIRIPAGALLAAGAIGEVSAPVSIAAGIVGGGLAATSHISKASARMLINTSPEPVTNWAASVGEDALVLSGLWMAVQHPIIFAIFLVIFLVLVIWLLPKIWYLLKKIYQRLRGMFSDKRQLKAKDSEQGESKGAQSLTLADGLQVLRAQGEITEEELRRFSDKLSDP